MEKVTQREKTSQHQVQPQQLPKTKTKTKSNKNKDLLMGTQKNERKGGKIDRVSFFSFFYSFAPLRYFPFHFIVFWRSSHTSPTVPSSRNSQVEECFEQSEVSEGKKQIGKQNEVRCGQVNSNPLIQWHEMYREQWSQRSVRVASCCCSPFLSFFIFISLVPSLVCFTFSHPSHCLGCVTERNLHPFMHPLWHRCVFVISLFFSVDCPNLRSLSSLFFFFFLPKENPSVVFPIFI